MSLGAIHNYQCLKFRFLFENVGGWVVNKIIYNLKIEIPFSTPNPFGRIVGIWGQSDQGFPGRNRERVRGCKKFETTIEILKH